VFNEEIELGNLIETNEFGEVIQTMVYEKRLANRLDDNRSEFYEGASSGLRPELTFEINGFEYNDEEFVRFPITTGTVYTIIRAAKRGEMRELTVSAHSKGDVSG